LGHGERIERRKDRYNEEIGIKKQTNKDREREGEREKDREREIKSDFIPID
jgi:hypothetical protein